MTYPCTECIMDMLGSSGPQDEQDMKRECKTQAVPYSEALFREAIATLVQQGKIVIEPNDGDPYYDFPESYYNAQVGIVK